MRNWYDNIWNFKSIKLFIHFVQNWTLDIFEGWLTVIGVCVCGFVCDFSIPAIEIFLFTLSHNCLENLAIAVSAMCSVTIFMVVLRGKAHYQRGHSAQYSGFKLATSTIVLSILKFVFIASSHKHYAFTITYICFGKLSLFACLHVHCVLWSQKKTKPIL